MVQNSMVYGSMLDGAAAPSRFYGRWPMAQQRSQPSMVYGRGACGFKDSMVYGTVVHKQSYECACDGHRKVKHSCHPYDSLSL
jgi:hypothetical protein